MPFDMAARIESWRAKLLDTGKRNRLIQFRSGLTGGVRLLHPALPDLWQTLVVERDELTFPWQRLLLGTREDADAASDDAEEVELPPEMVARCRQSTKLGALDLLTDLSDRRLASRLTRLATNARESLSEKGVTTLYVALGFLRWFETPAAPDELVSPLVLVPVVLERDSVEAPWRIEASDEEILPNHSLVQRLKADFNLTLPVPPDGCFDSETPTVASDYLAAVAEAVRHHERWQVLPECALGVFNFQKLAMWEDLGHNRARISSHELCRKIGGDALPLSAPAELPAESDLDDRLHPRQTFSILDADSSQQAAVLAAARGVNLIVDGPPGTGKSQTIANIIAEFLAAGRTVLFVSEKAAALEVVKRRLDRAGLGDFCLELHSARASKRDVLAELGRCLDLAQERPVDASADLQALYEVRQQLNAYARALHEVRMPLGLSPFQVHGELAQLPRLETRSRCPIANILQRDRAYVQQATDLLAGLPACEGVLDARGKHPWREALPPLWSEAVQDEVRFHLRRLVAQFPAARAAADMLAAVGLGSPQPTRPEWWTALANGQRMLDSAVWWQTDQRAALHAAARQHAEHQATLTQLRQKLATTFASVALDTTSGPTVALADRARSWGTYLLHPIASWRALRTVRHWFTASAQPQKFWDDLAVLGRFHAEEQACIALVQADRDHLLLDAAGAVDWQRTDQLLQAASSGNLRQQLDDSVQSNRRVLDDGFRESWDFLTTKLFAPNAEISTGIVLDRAPLPLLQDWVAARAEDTPRLAEWLTFRRIRQGLQELELLPLANELTAGELSGADAVPAFRARFYQLWLDAVGAQAPCLQQFTSDAQDRRIERFHDFDRKAVAHAAQRIRGQLLTSIRALQQGAASAPASSELGLLHHEVNKKRRHLPLRKLFAQVPTLLPRLKPCLMMSPLAVSTFLEAGDWTFDVVIFDEASQVLPQDAIGAIYRGKQLIVAGDQRQLPPTDFFQRADTEGEDDATDANLADFESILDVCCGIPLTRRRLRWHYRSRREALIAFSNRHFYDDELVTFPSADDSPENPAIRLEFVTEGRWKPNAGVNPVEAARAAAMIVAHFRSQPERSLGVIALNQAQQMRILDELERLRRQQPDLEDCFAEDADEPFFVKNLESVQGDERDVIFLCVGYGRDEAGTLRLNFGPLNRQGGERRLNVAVTRARCALVVLSSLRAQDIDLNRAQSAGAKLLRAYLDYAERGPASLGGAGKESQRAPAVFENAVADELTKQGFEVHRQVGCGGQPIDLAVVDPRTPGRYVLGIECDGATYHSFKTARDRDRLRQEVLHGLGWHLCRVWSTDWVRQRDGQLQRIQAAYERAQASPPAPPAPVAVPAPRRIAAADLAPAKGKAPRAVDESAVQQSILVTLEQIGATAPDDLAPAIARHLGFKRTSKQLQEKVEQSVNALLANQQLRRTTDGRLQRSKPGKKS